MSEKPETREFVKFTAKPVIPFNATDWKAIVNWGVREGLIRFPMSTGLEPDLSPDIKRSKQAGK